MEWNKSIKFRDRSSFRHLRVVFYLLRPSRIEVVKQGFLLLCEFATQDPRLSAVFEFFVSYQ